MRAAPAAPARAARRGADRCACAGAARRRRAWRRSGPAAARGRDAVGEHDRLLDVVGDEHDRARLRGQRAGEPVLHVLAGERVERRERLVEAQHRAARQQRARERHALAHPAGQLVGPRALEALQAEVAQQRGGPRAGRGAVDARHAQRERGVVGGAGPRQQQVALGHERGGVGVDAAGVGRDEPADELEQRRLAAAAGADDGDDLAGPGVEAERRPARSRPRRRGGAPANVLATSRRRDRAEPGLHLRWRLLGRRCPRQHRSLRGHYPTGSKGQRRPWALSQPACRQPPWFSLRGKPTSWPPPPA